MPAKRLVPLVVAVVLAATVSLAATAHAVPSRLIGLGTQANKSTLYSFSGEDLGTVTPVPVTGLGSTNLVGISVRPADGRLYGLAVSGNTELLFTIDPTGGAATFVGADSPGTISGAPSYGIDFNPVSDRLRVVDGLESTVANVNNFRVNPNNGAIAAVDTDLGYSALPGSEAGNRPLATIAYDRNFAGASATTLFGIAAGGDRLVRLGGVDGVPSVNGGALADIGPLGVDVSSNAGLDIDPATGEAYAILQVAGASGLYRIDLATGAATLVGQIAGGTITFGSLAIVPPTPVPQLGPPTPSPSQPPASAPPASTELQSLKIMPFAFVPAASGGPVGARKALGGAKVSYTLSAAAKVSFRLERKARGKFRPLKTTFAHSGQAGANGFRFSGRLQGKALASGRYKLTGSVGTSTRSTTFKVLPPAR